MGMARAQHSVWPTPWPELDTIRKTESTRERGDTGSHHTSQRLTGRQAVQHTLPLSNTGTGPGGFPERRASGEDGSWTVPSPELPTPHNSKTFFSFGNGISLLKILPMSSPLLNPKDNVLYEY